jgi:hypothetical protein
MNFKVTRAGGNVARRREKTENKSMEQTDPYAPAHFQRPDLCGSYGSLRNRPKCTPRTPGRAKMLTRVDPTLDRPVILFQDIVEILHRSMSTVLLQSALGFELYDGGGDNQLRHALAVAGLYP